MPDAGGLVIATDQAAARAYAKLLAADHRRGGRRGALRRPGARPQDRRVRRSPTTAGWSRCGWCPRASTSRGWRSASTRPASCTPLFFAQAIGRFVRARAARRDRVGVPAVACRRCWARQRDGGASATTCSAGPRQTTGFDDEALAEARGQRDEPDRGDELPFEALGPRRRVRPGDLRRRRVRHAPRPGREEEDYLGLPGLLEPDQVAALLRKRQAQQRGRRRAAAGGGPSPSGRAHERAARRCASSSTPWCGASTTAPAGRTGRSTPSCAALRRAARARRPPRSSCGSESRLHPRVGDPGAFPAARPSTGR